MFARCDIAIHDECTLQRGESTSRQRLYRALRVCSYSSVQARVCGGGRVLQRQTFHRYLQSFEVEPYQ